MFWKNKLINHPVSRTLLLAAIVFFGIILLSAIFLKIYTMHGMYRPVPELKGLSLQEAIQSLDENGLCYILNDSVFQVGIKPGAVIDQNPKAGIKVKKNRKVYIVINAINPQMIEMPNVVGVSRRQAKSLLESNGLIIGHIKYVPDIAFDNVLHQRYNSKDIESGTKIAKGSKIELILGRGYSNESANVPNITRLTLREAQSILTDSYLNLGITIYDKTVVSNIDSAKAIIFKQKPSPDQIQSIRIGSYIDVWLTIDTAKLSTNK
jgi:eukaryotic-like serine/threonine-protein kinase